MIWADRVAVVLAVLLSPVMLFGVDGFAWLATAFVVAAWAVGRGIDFIASGKFRVGHV